VTSVRTCVACGQRSAKADLRRFVREVDALRLDPRHRAAGRGAYLHHDAECARRFARGRGTVRSLRWAPSPTARMELAAEVERMTGEPR